MAAPSGRSHVARERPTVNNRVRETRNGNLILASLPPDELKHLLPHLQFVPLKPGQSLHEPNKPVAFGYFPNCGLISLLAFMQDGSSVEVAMAGKESFVGTAALLEGGPTTVGAIVQIEGDACKIEAEALRRVLRCSPALEACLRRCVQMELTQIAQCAACNCLHQVRARLSRWLLMSNDRTECDLLPVTQDLLAQILGCRRSSITSAARILQTAGFIDYSRGRVRILNRTALEASACECYAALKAGGCRHP